LAQLHSSFLAPGLLLLDLRDMRDIRALLCPLLPQPS
jgi:hypothetical protein